MNNTRRKDLNRILEELYSALQSLESTRDEEQECFENIPENLQGSEKYDNAESCVSYLDDACEGLNEIISNIENAIE